MRPTGDRNEQRRPEGERRPPDRRLLGRLDGADRDSEWLVQAFPEAPVPLLTEAAGRLQRIRYRRGDVIVAEGEAADRFYVITSGEVEVTQRSADRDVYITMYAAGDHFGEVGLLHSSMQSADRREPSAA